MYPKYKIFKIQMELLARVERDTSILATSEIWGFGFTVSQNNIKTETQIVHFTGTE